MAQCPKKIIGLGFARNRWKKQGPKLFLTYSDLLFIFFNQVLNKKNTIQGQTIFLCSFAATEQLWLLWRQTTQGGGHGKLSLIWRRVSEQNGIFRYKFWIDVIEVNYVKF